MMHPVETLMNEHRVIERGLDALDTPDAPASRQPTQPDIRIRLGELVRVSSVSTPTGSTTRRRRTGLFTALADQGFSNQSGPCLRDALRARGRSRTRRQPG